MRLLVLGGSVFLGRHVVRAALDRGWEVTTFNRGVTSPDLPGVEAVRGDRESADDLARLAGHGPWDAVVDVCGFTPRTVQASVRALTGKAGTYAFVSSVSAHKDFGGRYIDEDTPRYRCAADAGPDDGDYGELKAGCELAVEEGFDGQVLIVSPGIIIGPHENVGRIPYWLRRAARGGEFIAPGHPDRAMRLIDVRDVAAFILDGVDRGYQGRYLTTGVPWNTNWGELLSVCVDATGAGAQPVWIDDEFLLQHDVGVWDELPLWAPARPDFAGAWLASSDKALAAGLACRPVEESLRDTWAWLSGEDAPGRLPSYRPSPTRGLAEDKERRILQAWHRRHG